MLCHVFDLVPDSARQGVFDMMEQFDRPEFVMNAAFQQQALIGTRMLPDDIHATPPMV